MTNGQGALSSVEEFAVSIEKPLRIPKMISWEKQAQENKTDDWVAATLDDLIDYLIIIADSEEALILAQAKAQYIERRQVNHRK